MAEPQAPDRPSSTSDLIVHETRIASNPICLSTPRAIALAVLVGVAAALFVTFLSETTRNPFLLTIAGALLGFFFFLSFYRFALFRQEADNVKKWKKDEADFDKKKKAAEDATKWTTDSGKFSPAGTKTFAAALSVGGGGTIAPAFRTTKLLAMLAIESSFGTNLGTSEKYVGPYQLSSKVFASYNSHNDPDVKFPDDAKDLKVASQVAGWYLASLLQQLTWNVQSMGLGPIADSAEANKFALAAYNGGLGTINKARKSAKDKGKNPDKWEDVKDSLPADISDDKKAEIKGYVEKANKYEGLLK